MPINPVVHVLMLANVRWQNNEFQSRQIAIDVVTESCGYPEAVRLSAQALLKTHGSFGEATTAFYYTAAKGDHARTQVA